MGEREYPPASVRLDSPMTAEYRSTLLRLLADQARAELIGSHTYSSWVHRAPGPEEKMYVAEMAREETEHWYKTIKLLEKLGVTAGRARQYETRHLFFAAVHVLIPRHTWLDILMLLSLLEQGAYFLVEDFAQSSYAPWASVAQDILDEERRHADIGNDFLRAQIEDLGIVPVQRAVNKWWRVALNMFGPARTKHTDLYIRLGLKFRSNEERRQAFRQACEPRIRALGLIIPKLYRQRYPFF